MNLRLKTLGLKICMSVQNVHVLKTMNYCGRFAHCWDKRSVITVRVKTWHGENTQVSKIARGFVSWGDKITKMLIA